MWSALGRVYLVSHSYWVLRAQRAEQHGPSLEEFIRDGGDGGDESRPWGGKTQNQILALHVSSLRVPMQATFKKYIHTFSVPRFTFLSSGKSNRTHLTGFLWKESEIMQEQWPAQSLTQS